MILTPRPWPLSVRKQFTTKTQRREELNVPVLCSKCHMARMHRKPHRHPRERGDLCRMGPRFRGDDDAFAEMTILCGVCYIMPKCSWLCDFVVSACGLTHRGGVASVEETVSRRQDRFPSVCWHPAGRAGVPSSSGAKPRCFRAWQWPRNVWPPRPRCPPWLPLRSRARLRTSPSYFPGCSVSDPPGATSFPTA